MKLRDIKIPNYTLGEEIMNAITHGVGAALSIAALAVGVVVAVHYSDVWGVVSMSIFGAMLVLLYTMSTIYHSLSPRLMGKRVFRIIDHCSIFLLIAGTYTPYALVTLRHAGGWWLFGIVWGMAVVGIILNAVNLKKFSKISTVCYLVMGWAVVFNLKNLLLNLSKLGVILLFAGGIFYTIGAVIYVVGKKSGKKYMHSVWHFFTLAGSGLHYFSIILSVLMKK